MNFLARILSLAVLAFSVGLPTAACTQSAPASDLARTEAVLPHLQFSQPVAFDRLPGGAIWLVNEQRGRVLRFDAATKAPAVVALDLTDRVKFGGERGLLGLAVDPNFAKTKRIFVNYTTTQPGPLTTRISSFVSQDGGKTFAADSEDVVLSFEQPYGNHNGGHIAFGPDGMLYVGVGDGGSGGDPQGHGQNRDTLLGTILRLDVRGARGYAVPPDNPFVGRSGRPEIFAWGLRNPWKFSFAPDGSLWAADVGQNLYEEVNVIESGKNYGWNTMEGLHCYAPSSGCDKRGLTLPVLEYSHKEGQSITGGYVYRGSQMPMWRGHYIFGDFASGRIWAFDPKTQRRTLLVATSFAISTFIEDPDGELFFADYGDGTLQQLRANVATAPEPR